MSSNIAIKAPSDLPAFLQSKLAEAPRGMESVGAEDLAIPRIELVQAMSAVRKKNDPNFIDGASEGMLYNTVTRETYEEVTIIPVSYKKDYLVWANRKGNKKDAGFQGAYGTLQEAHDAMMEVKVQHNAGDNDFEVVPTPVWFVLVVGEGGELTEAVISFPKSRAKVVKGFNSRIRMTRLDPFAKKYVVSAVADANKNGDSFQNIAIRDGGWVDADQFAAAERTLASIATMSAKVDYASDSGSVSEEDDGL